MNKKRRKSLIDIIGQLETLQCNLEAHKGEEEKYLDNMPENLQGSERYAAAESACDNLESALWHLVDAVSHIEDATE